jgi:hypothetical protein
MTWTDGAVVSTEGEFAVDDALIVGGLEVAAERIGRDILLSVKVVGDGGDFAEKSRSQGSDGQGEGTNAEDTIDTLEALGVAGNADALHADHEVIGKGSVYSPPETDPDPYWREKELKVFLLVLVGT